VAIGAGVAYDLKLAGFNYAALGFGVSRDHYSKNLSFFTPGHGGYFSPQRYWRVGPSIDFLTEENSQFLIKGRVSTGRTIQTEAATPFFPLCSSCPNTDDWKYSENRSHGGANDREVSGVWRLNDHVQIGAMFAKRHSPQYDDYVRMGFLRFLFEPRKSVLSSDLMTSYGKDQF
jgi:hypothetical protein